MLRWLRRAGVSLILCYLLACGAIAAFAALQPRFEPEKFAPADVIVVVGAGMDAGGRLHRSSIGRVEKGVALFQAGAAPRLHFSGGAFAPNGPAAGAQMALLAGQLGVPRQAITFEDTSLSTLQNALFSQPHLQDAPRLIVVSEGFHLPRVWASFKWAAWQTGQSTQISVAHSTAFRTENAATLLPAAKMTLREGLAWGFNLSRLALWHAASLTGTPRSRRDGWLE